MDLKLISKRLNIPLHIVQHITTENWEQVYGYFKYRWNEDGYAAWKKNQNAVNRIVQVFSDLKKSQYNASRLELKAIGLYVDRLGVKVLIDDMKSALGKNPRIRTLMYFITTQKGEKLSRWGNLFLDKVEAEIKVEAEVKAEEAREVAAGPMGDLLKNTLKKIPVSSVTTQDTSGWLKKDKERLTELEAIPDNELTTQERGERVFLKMKIENINKGKWRVK